MYVIHPPDEFRKAVEGLRFNYDELESIPTNIKRWRVPQMLLKQHPIFFPLMQQYNKEVWPNAGNRCNNAKIYVGPTW